MMSQAESVRSSRHGSAAHDVSCTKSMRYVVVVCLRASFHFSQVSLINLTANMCNVFERHRYPVGINFTPTIKALLPCRNSYLVVRVKSRNLPARTGLAQFECRKLKNIYSIYSISPQTVPYTTRSRKYTSIGSSSTNDGHGPIACAGSRSASSVQPPTYDDGQAPRRGHGSLLGPE
ncbi:hypothetical protein EDB89DRAFT_1969745 [Lactarius sanguifluus]|nr:hypothetical protein EDB89DRAFT_1969745 [Lactarius sanguifluus]